MSDRSDDAPEEPALYRAFLLKSLEQLGDRIDRLDTVIFEQGKNIDALASAWAAAPKATDNRRKHLLARMAGNIAGDLFARVHAEPNKGTTKRSPDALHLDAVAETAVDLAERILRRIGL